MSQPIDIKEKSYCFDVEGTDIQIAEGRDRK